MLGAFRRSAVSQALRSSARTLSVRSAAQQFQPLPSSLSTSAYASKSLFHSSSLRFSSQGNAAVQENSPELQQELPEQAAFLDLADKKIVARPIIDALTRGMGLKTMTDVQRLTIPVSVTGRDVLAQAKTGTGKTIAFLIPVLQKLLSDPTVQRGPQIRAGRRMANIDIRTIIVSPTRELAEQIANEAKRVSSGSGLLVQCAVGGTQKRAHLQKMHQEGCHILVATPGRLEDILSDYSSRISAPKLSNLVLDEADRLLDEGFAPALLNIQKLLPDPKEVDRQTLLFSATVAPEVMGMVRQIMKPDFQFVKTVRDDEIPTHLTVPQRTVVLRGLENTFLTLYELFQRKLKDSTTRPFKAIVYLNATKQVNTCFEIFDRLVNSRGGEHGLGNLRFNEIHSGLTQAQRTGVASWFRKCQSGILFSSDVTSRGMDFPDVTDVIQIGPPRGRDDYIHRLGRTARANKTGEGWVLLHEGELGYHKRLLRDIPVKVDDASLAAPSLDMTTGMDTITNELQESNPALLKSYQEIFSAVDALSPGTKSDACKAQAATMASNFRDKGLLREAFQNLAIHGYGLRDIPRLSGMIGNAFSKGGNSGGFGRGSAGGREFSRGGRGSRDSFGNGRGGFSGNRGNRDSRDNTFRPRSSRGAFDRPRDHRGGRANPDWF
ncbi:P-loop containing nucleoside triphosphate hydrolase protein [Aspergillus californicus]